MEYNIVPSTLTIARFWLY